MDRIYLDHASSMPVDPRVLEFSIPYLGDEYGNPSSLHSSGLAARRALEEARQKVAELINAENEKCIVFTSGATEANNLAVMGRNSTRGPFLWDSSS